MLNLVEVEEQTRKWKSALIGYLTGRYPSFKEMLRFIYGGWHFIDKPMYSFNDVSYFIFRFVSEEDNAKVSQQCYYTFESRSMILK